MNINRILKLAEHYEKLSLGAWKKEKIDETNPQYQEIMLSEEFLDNISKIFKIRLAEILNKKYLNKQVGIDYLFESSFEIDLSDLPSNKDNILPNVFVEIISDPNKSIMPSPVLSSGKIDITQNVISINIYIQPETIIDNEVIKLIIKECEYVFRHEIQHFKQTLGKTKIEYISPKDSSSYIKYLLQKIEKDAHITPMFEKALEESKGENIINVEKFIEPWLWDIKKYLEYYKLPNDVIRHSLNRIRNKWYGWLRNKYKTKSV